MTQHLPPLLHADQAIGLFDSGIGGLTLLKALMHHLPQESCIYFGDTARFPYGDKSSEQVRQYACENAQFLWQQRIKALIVACNTSCALALDSLKATLPLPIIDIIAPAAQYACKATRSGHIAIMGTAATIHSGAYQRALLACHPTLQVTALSCPVLAPLIEEGFAHHPATFLILKHYLDPLRHTPVDTLLLGCTHYPFLDDMIRKILGRQVTVIDPAECCMTQLATTLQAHNLALPSNNSSSQKVSHRCFVSDNPAKFQATASSLLALPPGELLAVSLKPPP